jgi:hypothetical protein
MSIDTSLGDFGRSENGSHLQEFEKAHKEDLEAITAVLVKITHHTPQEIKPHLDAMIARLVESEKASVRSKKRARAFREWVESHRGMNLPNLSDEAISRESIYGERG